MLADLVIKNGKVVTPSGIISAGIAIDNEKIVSVAKDEHLPKGDKIINAAGKYVLPGCIDTHVHFGSKRPYEDDVKMGTASAVCGGVTTVMHFLRDKRSYPQVFQMYRNPIEKFSFADVAFHAMVLSDIHTKEFKECMDLGITSFKFLMAYKGPEGEALGVTGADAGMLYDGFESIRGLGGLPMVHAENIEIIYKLNPRYKDRKDLGAWTDTRPALCEEIDMILACKIAEALNSPLYVAHVSIGSGIDIIKEFRKRGIEIYIETCPHFLVIDKTGDKLKNPLLAKHNPPVRTKEDQAKLWSGIQKGYVNCIGTDTSSGCLLDQMNVESGNIWEVSLSSSSLETTLPILLSEGVNKGRISVERVAEVYSYNSAKIFGLFPQKGVIRTGSDADLTIVDLKKKVKILPEMLHSGADWDVYEGWELIGWPVITIVRGMIMVEDGEIVGKQGFGNYIPRRGTQS